MSITDNIKRIQDNIADACAKANRHPDEITLVAVSKTKPAAMLLEAINAGVQHLGENRVEESQEKIPLVNQQTAHQPIWHMIGHIQSRKARHIPELYQVVHSVDSLKLAQKLSRIAEERGKALDVMLEINVSGEEAKHGLKASNWQKDEAIKDTLWQTINAIIQLPSLNINGLMTMAPYLDDVEGTRPTFIELTALKATLTADLEIELPHLSMGMTNDYLVAIEEGATIVRIGRAIFGER